MENFPYIELITKEKLEKEDIKTWYRIVSSFLPSGLISSIQMVELQNGNEPILLIKNFDRDKQEYSYKIPVTRDLLPEEVESIADAYNDINGDTLEYLILASTLFTTKEENETEAFPIELIAKNIARYIHTKQLNKKLKDGWRYGIEDDIEEKVSSVLLPFDSLGPDYQNIDLDLVEEFIRLLNENGYLVIKKED